MFENLPLGANAAIFAAAAALVWYAGTRLSRYADGIARLTGIGHAAIGMLLLGSITSAPELAVAVTSALTGYAALSVNNVLGAAALNVAVLAVADAIIGREALTSTLASPNVLLQGLMSVVLLAIVVGTVVAGDSEWLGIGIGSWALIVGYTLAVRIVVSSRGRKTWIPANHDDAVARDGEVGTDEPLRRLLWRTALAGLAILGAGFLLSQSGAALAEQTGLGTYFFGAVLLAAATTLPEISTVYGAVRIRRYELAISDVFGTNMFNMLIIVVVDALDRGAPVLPEVGRFAAFGALLAIVLTVVLLVGMIERRDRTLFRMGLDSLGVLILYMGGLVVLYQLR